MGKKKKITEKVKNYYRGPIARPQRVADEKDMSIIIEALEDSLLRKDSVFKTALNGSDVHLKLVPGLSASLRCLKQNRSRAIIYDNTASPHLTKYLNEFANKISIPSIQANGLINVAPKFKLKTLMVITIANEVSGEEELYKKPGNVKPKATKDVITSVAFSKLIELLFSKTEDLNRGQKLRLPHLDKVVATDKSRLKKKVKRDNKIALKQETVNTNTCAQ